VFAEYGARGAMRPALRCRSILRQHLQEVVFRLTPHAVVIGRVSMKIGNRWLTSRCRPCLLNRAENSSRHSEAPTPTIWVIPDLGLPSRTLLPQRDIRGGMMFEPAVDRSAASSPTQDYGCDVLPGTTDAGVRRHSGRGA